MKERHEALTMNLELLYRDTLELRKAQDKTDEHVNALVRIAEIHERRLTALKGGESD